MAISMATLRQAQTQVRREGKVARKATWEAVTATMAAVVASFQATPPGPEEPQTRAKASDAAAHEMANPTGKKYGKRRWKNPTVLRRPTEPKSTPTTADHMILC